MLRRLNDSLSIDARLFREDIKGSKAWAAELHESGYLSKDDNESIQMGLDNVSDMLIYLFVFICYYIIM